MDTKKTIVLVTVASLLFAATGFAAGSYYQKSQVPGFGGDQPVRAMGGPMGQMSEEERAELESMSDEERQAFLQERMGGEAPGGGPARGGTLEGAVVDQTADTITIELVSGGSQTVYLDDETILAFAEDAGGLAVGADVLLLAEPVADGVTTARVVVVR